MFLKHVLGPLVLLVRLMPVLLSTPARGDICVEFKSPHIVKHINKTDGTQHCCKKIMCRAGTEVRYCSDNNPNDTSCQTCRTGFYNREGHQSHMNPTCILWRKCSSLLGEVFNDDGSSTEGGTCKCNVAKGFYEIYKGECKKKKGECEPDQELDIKTGKCHHCRLGYYQPEIGYGPCKHCPIDTYRLNHDKINCTQCPPNTYAPQPGSRECDTCEQVKDKDDTYKCGEVKTGELIEDETEGTTWKLWGPVLGIIILLICVILLVAMLVLHRRHKLSSAAHEIRKSPVHGPNPTRPDYRAVSSSSTSSSDNGSRSSAEDALEIEKIKSQNHKNQGMSMVNEKVRLPNHDMSPDYAAQPPAGQQQQQQQPGQPPYYQKPTYRDHDRFLIMSPNNCNITLGDNNELSMTPIKAPKSQPAGVHPAGMHPNEQRNNLNMPRTRLSAPPSLDSNSQGYSNQVGYYEDEADRIAAHYNAPDC